MVHLESAAQEVALQSDFHKLFCEGSPLLMLGFSLLLHYKRGDTLHLALLKPACLQADIKGPES